MSAAAVEWPISSHLDDAAKLAYYAHAAELGGGQSWEHLTNRERAAWEAAVEAILDSDIECECGQPLRCPTSDQEPYCPVCGTVCEVCVPYECVAVVGEQAGDIPLVPPRFSEGWRRP
jgi:hypothetical protein